MHENQRKNNAQFVTKASQTREILQGISKLLMEEFKIKELSNYLKKNKIR